MDGCHALMKPDAGGPAWRRLPLAQPTAENFRDGGAMDDFFKRNRLADFEQLLAACVELKARFIVCELGLKARGLQAADLRGDIPVEIAGVATLIGDAPKTGAMLFI
jgi:peroxiredoxin family protein